MATDLNRVLLIGRLTRDPELRQTGGGTSLCRFGIANNRNYTQNGERREEVSFFNCVAWGRQAEIINQYCRRGKQVAIEGRLKQNSWEDKDGKKQSAVDVVVESLQMLGSPGEQRDNDSFTPPGESAPPPPYANEPVPPAYGGGGSANFDDDIPF